MAHPEEPWQFQGTIKDQKVGGGPTPGNLHPFPKVVGIILQLISLWASLVAQLIKNLPAVQETWVWSLGWEDPLEKGKVIHSSILAWGHKESDMTEWFSLSLRKLLTPSSLSLWNYPVHKNQPHHISGSQTHPLRWPTLSLWCVFLSK